MNISDFDYFLPSNLIAQKPCFPRDESKMLCVKGRKFLDTTFKKISNFFNEGDVIVINNTKVIKANLEGLNGSKKINFTLHMKKNSNNWFAFAKPAKKCNENDLIIFNNNLTAKIVRKGLNGEVLLEFNISGKKLMDTISKIGSLPLPPYIKNKTSDDDSNYQSYFAKKEGAVASPTASLHFTKDVLNSLNKKGIIITPITLHVGAGTFLPVKSDKIKDHKMHYEWCEVNETTSKIVNNAKKNNKKIIAVGTTVLRTLESIALKNDRVVPWKGSTNLFIRPGFEFKITDFLLTNFHLPKSTLMILICAFYGHKNVFNLYQHAIKNNYRFYSYGDCCLLPKKCK